MIPTSDRGARIDWSFETPRVRARLVDERDRDLYRQLYTSPEVMAFVGPVLDVAAADEVFARVCRYNAESTMRARYWCLVHRRTDEAVGVFALVRKTPADPDCELGIMLLPSWSARGIAPLVLRASIEAAMSGRWGDGLDSLIGRHAPGNSVIGRIGAFFGFRPFDSPQGYPCGWRITREEWRLAHGRQSRIRAA
ncbi:MAG: GNAT family N-acetyltransferase [Pseudomonadota bacterium]